MSDRMQVGVRHRNGSTNIFHVDGCAGWCEALEYVLEQVSSAAVVLVLVQGDKGRPGMKVAA